MLETIPLATLNEPSVTDFLFSPATSSGFLVAPAWPTTRFPMYRTSRPPLFDNHLFEEPWLRGTVLTHFAVFFDFGFGFFFIGPSF